MEVARRLRAEEERRLKLQEYLAAKGKLKPENNCKPYLKDRTNLQNKKPPQSQQIFGTKKPAPNKGSLFAVQSNNGKTSTSVALSQKTGAGRIPLLLNAPANRSSKNPMPTKCSVLRQRPDHAGRTSQPASVHNPNAKKKERGEEAAVTLTVVLTKKHGEKPEVCVMDKASPVRRGQHAAGPRTDMSSKDRDHNISQAKQTPALQATKTRSLHHDYQTPSPAGKPVAVVSSGHIRIVSRVSLPGANTANERSFLIKSSRNDGSRQPVNVPKKPPEGNSQKTTCSTKNSSVAPLTMVKKKNVMDPMPVPKIRPRTMGNISKRMSCSQDTRSLTIVQRRRTAPPGVNKVDGVNNEPKKQTRETKQPVVTGATKTATSRRPSSLMTTDATCRPQTPRMTAEERKKKLQEWLNSKGKTYKRPPMVLPPKKPPTAKKQNPCNRSLWEGIEEEEELLSLSKKIIQTLSDCLELIEKGMPADDIHAALDKVPEGKKFAKYWVCKARLLEREGVYDVIDVYKQGVQFGATPIDELRDVVFEIMRNTNKKTKVVTFGPLPDEEETENPEVLPVTPFIARTEEVKTPCTGTSICDQGSAVKLQITSLSSKKPGSGPDWKRLTPVRRSVRIHHSVSQYPEVVQEHDTVVSSLEELLDKADTDAFLYMRNEALPEEAGHKVLSLMKTDPTEEQQEGPV